MKHSYISFLERKPLTEEQMKLEIASSYIKEPYTEFSEKSVDETLEWLNLVPRNVEVKSVSTTE
jgi:hypothetical protein